jgi:hypothetical protein
MWFRAWVCGGLNAETTGLNPTEDMGIHLLCLSCVVKVMPCPLRQADYSFKGVLLCMYVCVWVCVCLILRHLETSKMRQPRHNLGCSMAKKKIILHYSSLRINIIQKVNMYSLLSTSTAT